MGRGGDIPPSMSLLVAHVLLQFVTATSQPPVFSLSPTIAPTFIRNCTTKDVFDVGFGQSYGLKRCSSEYQYVKGHDMVEGAYQTGHVCESSCYHLALISLQQMAHKYCDLYLDTMKTGIESLIDEFASDMKNQLNLTAMIANMTAANVTVLTHDMFKNGAYYTEQMCILRNTSRTNSETCATQFRAIYDINDTKHDEICNGFSKSCDELQMSLRAYGKSQPFFKTIETDFAWNTNNTCDVLRLYNDELPSNNVTVDTTTTSSSENQETSSPSSTLSSGIVALIVVITIGVVVATIYLSLTCIKRKYKPVSVYCFDDDDELNDDEMAMLPKGDKRTEEIEMKLGIETSDEVAAANAKVIADALSWDEKEDDEKD